MDHITDHTYRLETPWKNIVAAHQVAMTSLLHAPGDSFSNYVARYR